MASDWPKVQVSEVCEFIVDCVNKTAPTVEGPTAYKMVRTTNIRNGRIDLSQCRYVDKVTFEKWTRRQTVQSGDVLLTREAPIGEVDFVDTTESIFLGQRVMQYRANPQLLDARYLLYSFLSEDLQYQFGAHEGSGSVVSHIRVGDCDKFKISLPPLAEQRRIAHILGTLDDKIELNRQLNTTLEQLARALFQSWFVDFDPVRAKASGEPADSICRRLGLTPELLALFPTELDESVMGEIPVGWEASTIGQALNTVLGGTPSRNKPELWGGTIPWINSGKANEFRILEPSEYITEAGLNQSAAKLLPSRTTVLAITGATLGQVSLTEIETSANQSIVGVLGAEHLPNEFVYAWIKANINKLIERKTGAAHQHINKADVNSLGVIIPDTLVMDAFIKVVLPIFDSIKTQEVEIMSLATLRDELLPKLLSGDLRLTAPAAKSVQRGFAEQTQIEWPATNAGRTGEVGELCETVEMNNF